MTFKTLLVHLDSLESGEQRLRYAAELAGMFGASVTALYVDNWALWVAASAYGPEFTPAIIDTQRAAADARLLQAKARFERVANESAVVLHWINEEGDTAEKIRAHAAYADLVVVGGCGENDGGEAGVNDRIILGSGRPVLLLPSDVAGVCLKKIVVGWDGSREAARVLSDALPLLQRAGQVSVVTVVSPADAEQRLGDLQKVSAYLRAQGIVAETSLVEVGKSNGESLLAEVERAGADLLLIGGYGHSRWREIFLGGCTRHVLRNAELPVLISH